MGKQPAPEDKAQDFLDQLASSTVWGTVLVREDQDVITVFSKAKALAVIEKARVSYVFLSEYEVASALYHQVEVMAQRLAEIAQAHQQIRYGTHYGLDLSSARCHIITTAIQEALTMIGELAL